MERRNNESKASVASDQVLMRMASRREDEIHDKLSKIQKASTSASPSRPNPTVVAGRPTGEHASMTVNPGKARSMFLVVSFSEGRHNEAIYEVKFKRRCKGEVFDDDMGREAAPLLEPLAKFSNMFFLQSASISSKIYLLQQDTHDESSWPSPARSLGGYVFDTETRTVIPSIPPTIATKPMANVVSANGKLYYLASPYWSRYPDDPCFERYDPNLEVWESMPPFPSYDDFFGMEITGYAVCYGVILFSLCNADNWNSKVLAFHESRKGKEWNHVEVNTSTYAPFHGRAVVVGETIYALNRRSEKEIMAFSFRMDKGDDGGVVYSLRKLFKLRGLKIASPPLPFHLGRTEYLVHLGNHDFCHIKSGTCKAPRHVQYLCITTFQIVVGKRGRHMIKTLHSTVRSVDLMGNGWFSLKLCFTP
ncbi:unnamed protein product [Prunus armeniaca]|uniref:F-box associated domain-containing protein n=1 Tax=Prunus armeniaca TaxID=36596 RepID=A0A6J5XHQ9_PRUAR|nr:unnamed protein product [Prunus armeniaca]